MTGFRNWIVRRGLWIALTWVIVFIVSRKNGLFLSENIWSIGQVIDYGVKPSLVTLFLFLNSPENSEAPTSWGMTATLLSYFGTALTIFADPGNGGQSGNAVRIAASFCFAYYSALGCWSLFSLGRSFKVLPESGNLITGGPYQFVRHPIYACYIFGGMVLLIKSFNALLAFGFLTLLLSLFWRSQIEERVFRSDVRYQQYVDSVKNRFISWYTCTPVLLFLAIFVAESSFRFSSSTAAIRVHLSYPVLSLDPTIYDDWGSVFVGNHIYSPLISDRAELGDYQASSNLRVMCAEGDPRCFRSRIEFGVREIKDCNGNIIDTNQITRELDLLLKKKNWILPKHRIRAEKNSQVSIEFNTVPDIRRRLENLYFRFGWSAGSDAKKVGTGPFCLEQIKRDHDGYIVSGTLISRSKKFPEIQLFYSAEDPSRFDLALYGLKEKLSHDFSEYDTRTPLAYFLLKNPKIRTLVLPWETIEGRNFLADLFESRGVISKSKSQIFREIIPSGAESRNNSAKISMAPAILQLPDFIPDCTYIAASIEKKWNTVRANCINTSELIQKYVVPGIGDWDSFITPLTPGASYPNAIVDQYFNPGSLESYIKEYVGPRYTLFSLIGIGASKVVINRKTICGVRPRSLGLGDLMVYDLEVCK